MTVLHATHNLEPPSQWSGYLCAVNSMPLYITIIRPTVACGAESLTLNSYDDMGNENMEKNTWSNIWICLLDNINESRNL